MTPSSDERRSGSTADGASGLAAAAPQQADTPMTGTYIAVIVVEAIIIVALWVLGRMYA